MKYIRKLLTVLCLFFSMVVSAQSDWTAIKSHATFHVPDTSYNAPGIQPLNVPGWEDGLYMTRDGRHLYSTYLPLDAFSWIIDLQMNPVCFNFHPYYRPPLLGIDTITNVFGCSNYMQSDIIISSRTDTSQPFPAWSSSNLQTPFSFDGGADGVLLNADTFDVFVYTKDGTGTQHEDIMFMKNVPVNPGTSSAVPILSTTAQEDNPDIERLNDSTLLLFFDRDRYIHYSLSYDNGNNWQTPLQITHVLNDQAPYDVQPHLWNDGSNWWVYFCANNSNSIRCIYRSRQLIPNDWDSWGEKELVIEPDIIIGSYGTIFGIGEPTITQWGDISFVVVYGNNTLPDTTDVFDCDPWILTKKRYPLTGINASSINESQLQVFPNPASDFITIRIPNRQKTELIRITDLFGVLLKEITISVNTEQVNIEALPGGIYFIGTNNSLRSIRKLIKL